MHNQVEKDIVDGQRTMRINSSDSYLIARELISQLSMAFTNENMLKIMQYIDSAKYADIGDYKENIDKWKERTMELLRKDRIIFSSSKHENYVTSYDIHELVNKLYSTIPLVPSNNLIQNITQDIQLGLYKDCGNPDENWDKWKKRCIDLLKERRIL